MAGDAAEWDAVAASYESTVERVTGYFTADIVDYLRPEPGRFMADIAAGPGVVAIAAAQRGASVLALDLSEAMVERLGARANELGLSHLIEAFAGDAEALPFDDSQVAAAASNFGVIFCPHVDRALSELARITAPGGELMITAWTTEARNGWTALLPPGYADRLGFALPPRVMFQWDSADELGDACRAAGWVDVTVETRAGIGPAFASWRDVGEALEAPASKASLAPLTDGQRDALTALVVQQAHAAFPVGAVELPREAWLARGVASSDD